MLAIGLSKKTEKKYDESKAKKKESNLNDMTQNQEFQ